ncbi:MAG: glycosyltransferase [Lachnospiraceae bacterium]|jgi:glycosyltransferase involved in cell wall biosynthesis|nr:glycosyltransferase [Lachnospiraceae bacterium]
MCKVSIIVPTYNVAPYIRECMDSLIHQTLKEIEILCVDAASGDGTREILEEYARQDPRVRILEDEKHSTGYAKNLGVEQAQGPYIGIVESDDYVAPDMFERLYHCAVRYDTDLVKANYRAFTGNGAERIFALKAISLDRRDYGHVVDLQESGRYFGWDMYTWTGIYKKSFLREFGIRHNETPGAAFQDVGFWLQVFACARTAYLIPDYLYHYRRDNPYSSVHQSDKVREMPGEYRFGMERIAAGPGLTERTLAGICRGMYRSYECSYELLAQRYRNEFAETFHQDMRKAYENGALCQELFTEEEWPGVLAVVDSPQAYETYQKEKEHDKEKNRQALCRAVDGREKNIIFGAGSDGTNLLAWLRAHNRDKTEAFCDNAETKWGASLNGIPVISPSELTEKAGRLVIVASKLYSREIREQLTGLGVEAERIYICNVGRTIPSYL